MSQSTFDTSPSPGAFRGKGAIPQPPHYTSGRYSAQNLAQGYQGVLDAHHEHEAESYQARPTTPRPKTPFMPSSAFTEDSAGRPGPASGGLEDYTHLTIPEPDEEDVCDIVRSVAVPNPFKATVEDGCGRPIVQTSAVDALSDGEKDMLDASLTSSDPFSGVGLAPAPHTRPHQGSNEIRFNKSLVFVKALTDNEASPTEEPPAGDEDPAADPEEDKAADCDYETNSNWDDHEQVKQPLAEYERSRSAINGHEKWTKTQARLHKLIALRGSWPMLARSWTFYFKMRNIYPWVYAPGGTKKRVAINAKSNECRAAKALEALFDLSPLICSYRKIGMDSRIRPSLRRALEKHMDWAIRDAGLENHNYIPTLQVYDLDPADFAPSDDDSNAGSDESDPISDEVEKRLRKLASEHRQDLVLPEDKALPEAQWRYRAQPPLLFAYVIVLHIVLIISLDSARTDSEIVVFAQIDMAQGDQWLWNALALTLPVHVVRDALWESKATLSKTENMELDDPDL